MKLYHLLITAVSIAAVSSLTACRKDLCYNHFRTAAVTLDWEQQWERDYGMAHIDNWDATLHGFGYHELLPAVA